MKRSEGGEGEWEGDLENEVGMVMVVLGQWLTLVGRERVNLNSWFASVGQKRARRLLGRTSRRHGTIHPSLRHETRRTPVPAIGAFLHYLRHGRRQTRQGLAHSAGKLAERLLLSLLSVPLG